MSTYAIGISISKNLHALNIKPFWAFLPGQNKVFFLAFPIWKSYLFLKNTQSSFEPERTAQNHLKIPACRFLDMPFAMMVVTALLSQMSVCMPYFQLCHKPAGFLVCDLQGFLWKKKVSSRIVCAWTAMYSAKEVWIYEICHFQTNCRTFVCPSDRTRTMWSMSWKLFRWENSCGQKMTMIPTPLPKQTKAMTSSFTL